MSSSFACTREIADGLGCSPNLVYFRLERRGIARRPRAPRHGVGPAATQLAHLYWDCGLSLRDLAGRYGVVGGQCTAG
jgi:hypothetical protein